MAEHDELSEVQQDVATIKESLRWHKWLLFALVAVNVSPKLGGPSAPDSIAQILPFLPGA
jgi:hypothetical protein